jgi:hypothetical protein
MFQGYAPEAYYVYIAQCANGAIYTGYTKDVGRRITEHNSGWGGLIWWPTLSRQKNQLN